MFAIKLFAICKKEENRTNDLEKKEEVQNAAHENNNSETKFKREKEKNK